jgi:thioredoxin reductase (NADPH)
MTELELRAIAFPKLEESRLAALGKCVKVSLKRFRAGEKLYQAGAKSEKFFVFKSGEVEVIDDIGDKPEIVTIHGPGSFSGEVAELTGGPVFLTAIARTDVEAYEICPDALREILNNHPDLGDIILQAFVARRQLLKEPGKFAGLQVIGSRYSQDTFRVRDFLAGNQIPFLWLDLEADPHVSALLRQFGVGEVDTPVVAGGRKMLLRNPSNRELAEALSIRRPLERTVYDLVIVGAGPAGLAAAVYGASEGLKTLVLERWAPGGQAGRSMRIENYLGFPTGVTGGELAERARLQAAKFGAEMSVPTPVTSLTFPGSYAELHVDGGEKVTTKCMLISTGADYRRLPVDGCEPLEGRGVYYAATPSEAQFCRGAEAIVVGGGNSAGQAAVYLAPLARKVYLVIRGDDLRKNMSSYLASRIEQIPNVEVLLNTEVSRMSGDGHLAEVQLVNKKSGKTRTVATPALFSFIGAVPRTDWLPEEIRRDDVGFVLTGPELARSSWWTALRPPFLLETSRPGVFAAGDVRSGSVKRVASAVGEGAMAVQFVHEYLRAR